MSIRSKILLTLQFLCFGYFALFQQLLTSGILLLFQISGFALCIWSIAVMGIGNFNAQPEVKTGAKLIRKGPYSILRNPMYTGLLLFFGFGLIQHFNWPGALVFILLCFVFALKIIDEEKFLSKRFGNSYLDYKRSTYRLIPLLW